MKKMITFSPLVSLLFLILLSSPLLGQDTGSELAQLPLLKAYTNHRVSSYDQTGANDDGNWKNKIQPGETRTIAELTGPGIISHTWITIATAEHYHLKKIVIRMYWDGESSPSIEAPIGDFFGLPLGKYYVYESIGLSVGSQKALNCFFPMPFRKSAKVTITNEGNEPIGAFYYNIDWEKHASLPADIGYFHAQYHQSTPTDGWSTSWNRNGDAQINQKPNLKGEGNYLIMEAEGRGHYIGVSHGILQNQGDWWGEGDEMIFIDGATDPQITGTGSEDYYLGAWCYGGCGINPFGGTQPTFAHSRYGNPVNGGDNRGAEWVVYRYHTESPLTFQKSIRVTIEHGHANHRSDNFYTVGYWYQQEPHRAFGKLPPMEDRLPRLFNVDGPTVGKP